MVWFAFAFGSSNAETEHLPGYLKRKTTGRILSIKKASYIRLLISHVIFFLLSSTSVSILGTTDRGGGWGGGVDKGCRDTNLGSLCLE